MAVQKLKKDIYFVGARHWDRRLFDELIPLPDGTTYNAYLIKGSQKNALIDTVDPDKGKGLINNLRKINLDQLDYVIANHAEQDHSGTIPAILELFPQAVIVTNEKCRNMLMDLLHLPAEKFKVVQDEETLSLGNRTLQFLMTPWVHWPETMSTYLQEDQILFSCDFFGSHYATSELFVQDEAKVYESAKRYYAEIMMPFRIPIRKNMQKLADYEIKIIAPSHGPVYDHPALIMDAYRDWISDAVKNEVILPYVSMHGSTQHMVDHLIDALTERDIVVKPFNLTVTDLGELAISLVDAATVVLATPTVLAGPHPAMVYAAYLANILRPKTRFAAIIGSYGWGGKTEEQLQALLGKLKVDLLPTVLIKGDPRDVDFQKLDELAAKIAEKHQDLKK